MSRARRWDGLVTQGRRYACQRAAGATPRYGMVASTVKEVA